MTSTLEADIPQPQRLQQQQGVSAAAAVVAPPSSGSLSYDDVSKYFSLPIAEAASILGVCTSVLKRICRNNGIIRWPYRKFLAGKTVEDIRKDAAREKSMKLAELSNIAKQRAEGSNIMPSTSVGLSSTFSNHVPSRMSGPAQEMSKLQRGVSTAGHVSQPQDTSFLQFKWSNMAQSSQTKNIPTYMDEFKYGFPAKGLSSTSIKWWGSKSSSSSRESTTDEEAKNESCDGLPSDEPSRCTVVDEQTDPSAFLRSLRQKAVECGHKSLKVGTSKVFGSQKLGRRQRLLLLQIFKSSLPDHWNDMLS